MLTIYEALFLLALDEDRGAIASFAKKTLAYGLSGAILAELALQGRICANEKQRLVLVDPTPTGDETLDEVLSEIRSLEKPRKLSNWITQIGERPKKLRERVGEQLVSKNVLSQDDRRLFRQIPSPEAVDLSAPSKFEIKLRLRAMTLSTDKGDPRNLVLLAMAGACDLLNLIFTQDELEIAKQRVHEEMVRSALENPAMETIEVISQAISTSLEDDLE